MAETEKVAQVELHIREARPADAHALICYVRRIIQEPGLDLSLSPGEFDVTEDEEREILSRYAAAENAIYLVAEVEGSIVGILVCNGGTRRATRHVATLGGMSVAREWRGRGIGTQLMRHAMDWARASDTMKRVELSVFARNRVAIRLYRRFGFVVEGRRRKVVYRDSEYLDDLMMGQLLFED